MVMLNGNLIRNR